MRWVQLAALGLVAQGCVGATSVEVGDTFSLSRGQSVTLRPAGPVVQFVNVEDEQRCLRDVVCIWEGFAVLALQVGTENLLMSTHDPDHGRIELGDVDLVLTSLEPLPSTLEMSAPELIPYQANFTIE